MVMYICQIYVSYLKAKRREFQTIGRNAIGISKITFVKISPRK